MRRAAAHCRRRGDRQDGHARPSGRVAHRAGARPPSASCCSPSPAGPPPRCSARGRLLRRRERPAPRRRGSGAARSTPTAPACCASTATDRPGPGFTIMDRGDSEDLLERRRARAGAGRGKRRRFRRRAPASTSTAAGQRRRSAGRGARRALPLVHRAAEGLKLLFAAYTDAKEEQRVLDYDDLLLFWHALLADRGGRPRSGARFDHVLVDEYQDTNALQADIVACCARTAPGSPWSATTRRPSTASAPPPCATSSTSRRLPRRRDRRARAELPLHRADPRRHQRGHRRGRRAPRQGALDVAGGGARPELVTCARRGRADGVPAGRASSSTASRACRSGDRRCCSARRTTPRRSSWSSAAATIPFHKYGGLRFVRPRTSRTSSRSCASPRTPGPHGRHSRARARARHRPATAPALIDGPAPRRLRGRGRGVRGPGGGPRPWPDLVALFARARPPAPSALPAQSTPSATSTARCSSAATTTPRRGCRDLDSSRLAAALADRARFLSELVLDPPGRHQDSPAAAARRGLARPQHHPLGEGAECDAVYVIHAADGNIPSDMATGGRRDRGGAAAVLRRALACEAPTSPSPSLSAGSIVRRGVGGRHAVRPAHPLPAPTGRRRLRAQDGVPQAPRPALPPEDVFLLPEVRAALKAFWN